MTSSAAGFEVAVGLTAIAGWLVLATAALLAWLWPIGVGGKMPVGGDVTSFSWV